MRLNKGQRKQLLEWVGEGLQTDEINRRAAQFDPPFSVSRQQVDGYRSRSNVVIGEIIEADRYDALSSGLSIKENRVKKLQRLADRLEVDIFGENLWVTDVKAVGRELAYIERFNASEVSEYRGVLDDIAREMGDRATKHEVTGEDGKEIVIRIVREDKHA